MTGKNLRPPFFCFMQMNPPSLKMISDVTLGIGFVVFIAGTYFAGRSRFASLTGRAAMVQGAFGVLLIMVLLASRSIKWWSADCTHIALAIFMTLSGCARFFLSQRLS